MVLVFFKDFSLKNFELMTKEAFRKFHEDKHEEYLKTVKHYKFV